MKSLRTILPLLLIIILTFSVNSSFSQGVSINESGDPPANCAILDIQPDVSLNKGLLLPRLTTPQRDAIPAPLAGLMIYNTTTECFEIYNGTIWYSTGCQCTGAPAASSASSATGVSGGGFTANWGSVLEATTYYLDVATDATFLSLVTGYNNLNVGTVTSYSVIGLNCNVTYYYRVRAANACGASASSNTISQLTTSAVPPSPVSTAASGILGSAFTANWTGSGGTAYFLDVATDASFTSFVSGYNNLDVGNVLSYSVNGLGCNSIYYYRVRSGNSCEVSTSSNSTTVTTGTSVPSSSVASAATSVTGGSFYANWNTLIDASTYFLDVATDPAVTTFVAGYNNLNVGGVSTYNITGLNCNTTYYYQVRAANGCGTNSNSNVITQATSSGAATSPLASSASLVTASSFAANWSAVGSATKYFLDVATDAAFTAFHPGYQDLDVGNVTSYSVTGLSCGATYYYRVRAYNPCGLSASSNTITEVAGNNCVALNSWLYKTPITVTNSGATSLTGYQVQVTLNTQTLVGAGKMQSGGEDIRVTDEDKCTELDFWIETPTINTTTTQIWVKVPSILATSSKTIYIYYGNAVAVLASSGDNTFNFFDDFNSFDGAKWSGTGSYSVSGGELIVTTGSVYSNSVVPSTSQPGFIQEAKVKWTAPYAGYSGMSMANSQATFGSNGGVNKLSYLMTNNNSASVQGWAANGTVSSYNIASGAAQLTASSGVSQIIGQEISSTQVSYYNNRLVTNSYAGTWAGPFYVWLGYFTGGSAGGVNITDIATDWILVRQAVSPAPTATNGTEEGGCD